jgi:DNA replication protein DnaC
MTLSHEPTLSTSVAPQVLLGNHLKTLKLPTFAREYEKVTMESAQDRADYPRYLLRLCELERIDRERRNVERRIRMARFPQTKSLDTFDFVASHRSTNRWFWNWHALNGLRSAITVLRSAPPALAKLI